MLLFCSSHNPAHPPSLISLTPHSVPPNASHHHPPPEIKAHRPPHKRQLPGAQLLRHPDTEANPKGARMGKFRIKQGEKEDFRAPEEFIYLQGVIVGKGGKT